MRRWRHEREVERRLHVNGMPETPSQREAAARARQLLQRLLTEEQLAYYRHRNLVVVCTQTARYEISPRGMVIAHRDGREFALCIQFAHPADGALPPEDLMIAKLLLIRSDEEGLWQRFGPQAYRPDVAAVVHRGEMILPHGILGQPQPVISMSTVCAGPPVHFTEDLRPR